MRENKCVFVGINVTYILYARNAWVVLVRLVTLKLILNLSLFLYSGAIDFFKYITSIKYYTRAYIPE